MEELIIKKLKEITENGKLDQIVTETVTKAIQQTARDVFESYGDIAKALKQKITTAVMAGVEKLDFVPYSQSLTDLIKAELDQSVVAYGLEPARQMIKKFTGQLEKKEYKLSEIIEQFKEDEVLSEIGNEGKSGEISFHFDADRTGSWVWIYFDKEANKRKYSCDYKLAIDRKDCKLVHFTNEKEQISLLKTSGVFGFNLFLFKLYACQCTITLDEGAVDENWSTDWD